MPRHTKLAAGRKDMYYHMAKETGYRSRAAFKLLQLNRKYNLLSDARCLVDLCAAPGGWSQVAIQHMPVGSLVIAVDLDPIKAIPGLQAFQSDITSQHCRNELKRLLASTPVDIVVHDGAPNVSGDYMLDSFNQNVLVLWSLKLASEFLKQGGNFVTKVFRSGEHMQLIYVLKQLFETVEMTKPESSRETSAEIFVVCKGFKGQFAEVDQRMFDPEIVLSHKTVQEMSLKSLVKDLDYNTRHRHGYENDLGRKVADSVSLIVGESPIQILAKYHSVLFDFDLETDHRFKDLLAKILTEGIDFNDRSIKTLEEFYRVRDIIKQNTDSSIIDMLTDIKQLSKPNLQKILTWQRKTYGLICQSMPVMKTVAATVIESNKQTVDELVKEQELQLQKQKHDEIRKLNNDQKKKQLKQLKKFANFDKEGIDNVAFAEQKEGLFDINKISESFQEGKIMSEESAEEVQEKEDPNIIPDRTLTKNEMFIFNDTDQQDYYDQIDEEMNVLYDQYTNKRRQYLAKQEERNQTMMAAKGLPKDLTDMWFGQSEFANKAKDEEDDEFAKQYPLPRDNLIKTKMHDKRVKALKMQARELEKEQRLLNNLKDEHKFGSIQIVREDDEKKEKDLIKQGFGKVTTDTVQDIVIVKNTNNEEEVSQYYYEDDEELVEGAEETKETEEAPQETAEPKEKQQSLNTLLNKQNIEGTAMKIAMAQSMLRKKSSRALEESAFSTRFYAQDDEQYGLPDWFVQDELQNNQPNRPITAEDVAEIKEKLKEINSMPRTKKEREAVARKKMHAHQKLSQAQEKTQEIINREDLSEREKIKKLKQLQSKSIVKPKMAKMVYSNLHKGQAAYTGKVSRSIKFVDKRMKKEIRAEKKREKKYGKRIEKQPKR
ncbi:FtsJ_cell division protein [Hexamita inflata]|uniref:Putative n=1 Tax=Hexamita inflata TaxID=28002 RepID=A0AA86U2R4_9EUKA|nr:FtsJ cell division protein [Hexamita inflata]CAI9942919.1 FtsJ cell division protein [Hexamita inflata]